MHLVSALTMIVFLQVNASSEQIGSVSSVVPAQVAREAGIAPARRKVSKRHLEIIDGLAANPERKRTKGSSLLRDAQKLFQEEGLDEMNRATILRYMRDSAIKQGISNRNKVVTEAHRKIIRELPAGTCGMKELLQIASRRFEEAGLEKISGDTVRKHLKNRERSENADYVVMEEVEEEKQDLENPWFGAIFSAAHREAVRDVVFSSLDKTDDLDNVFDTEEFEVTNLVPQRPMKIERVRFSKAHKDILLEILSKRINSCNDKKLLWKEVSQEFEKRGLKRVTRRTLWNHLKMINSADVSQKYHDKHITAENEDLADAVGGLLLLRDGEA